MSRAKTGSIIIFAMGIFLSALLLFAIQPMIAKSLLPQFGGGAGVWTVSLVFFQAILLLGYLYADRLSKASQAAQIITHGTVGLTSLFLLPRLGHLYPLSQSGPLEFRLFLMLTMSIGLPYLFLSANGPLLQSWLFKALPSFSLYRMYALSNAGSLLGLFLYPLYLELKFPLNDQFTLWSRGFGILWIFVLLAGWMRYQQKAPLRDLQEMTPEQLAPARIILWLLLSATASWLLVSVTTVITQDVASFPLLWILPLALYLVTFIVAFQSERAYSRIGAAALFFISLFTAVSLGQKAHSAYDLVFVHLALFFTTALICHGELAKSKPSEHRLTLFYLMVALGGTIGGSLASLAAPYIFSSYKEFGVGMLAATTIFIGMLIFNPQSPAYWKRKNVLLWAHETKLFTLTFAVLLFFAFVSYVLEEEGVVAQARNFYGHIKVTEVDAADPHNHRRELVSGTTIHGAEYLHPSKSNALYSYYNEESGAKILLDTLSQKQKTIRVGLIGLGTGGLALYGRSGDIFIFYEINPLVEEFAHTYFSFLKNSAASTTVVLGDARVSLEKAPDQKFDALLVDAFTSDAIPAHLLTKEALELYLRRLKPEGVLAFHISNRHIDLEPVLQKVAETLALPAPITIRNQSRPGIIWMLMSRDRNSMTSLKLYDSPGSSRRTLLHPWTDNSYSLLPLLKL